MRKQLEEETRATNQNLVRKQGEMKAVLEQAQPE